MYVYKYSVGVCFFSCDISQHTTVLTVHVCKQHTIPCAFCALLFREDSTAVNHQRMSSDAGDRLSLTLAYSIGVSTCSLT